MNLSKTLLTVAFLLGISGGLQSQNTRLYSEIAKMDSLFFGAYNNCDTALQRSIYSDKIEFYHDKNGLDTSKANIIEATGKYICGKVSRELVPGSLEVYAIEQYGAISIGLHQFRNKAEGNQLSPPFKFIIFWKNNNGKWNIEKVISLHVEEKK